jgi:hypothetical protein
LKQTAEDFALNQLLVGSGCTKDQLHETITQLRSLADDLESVCSGKMPATPEVFVREWFIANSAVPCLVGRVAGHPTVKGDFVATTQVHFLNQSLGLARTTTRWYRLGHALDPDKDVH